MMLPNYYDLCRMGRASFCEPHHFMRKSDGFHCVPKKTGHHSTHPTGYVSPSGYIHYYKVPKLAGHCH